MTKKMLAEDVFDGSKKIFREGQKVNAFKLTGDEWEVKKGSKSFILYDDDFEEEVA